MKTVIQHEKYGEIVYEESFWTGKPSLTVNGVALSKAAKKKCFALAVDDKFYAVEVQGTFLKGVSIVVDGEKIQVVAKPTWYTTAIAAFTVLFVIIWGSIPALVPVFPIVGGALGGLISALFACLQISMASRVDVWWKKLLIGVLGFGAALFICWLLAFMILTGLQV